MLYLHPLSKFKIWQYSRYDKQKWFQARYREIWCLYINPPVNVISDASILDFWLIYLADEVFSIHPRNSDIVFMDKTGKRLICI